MGFIAALTAAGNIAGAVGGVAGLLGGGGKKAPPPPAELSQYAREVGDLGLLLRDRLGNLTEQNDWLAPKLRPIAERGAARLAEGATRARGTAADFAGLFDDGGADVLREATQEALLAGNETRQEEEAHRAREATTSAIARALAMQQDEANRRGFSTTGAASSPALAALLASQGAQAENAARLAERRWGEDRRLAFAPLASGFADSAISNYARSGMLENERMKALTMAPNLIGTQLAQEQVLGKGAADILFTGHDMFATAYNAALGKANADRQRKGSIFDTLGGLAGGGGLAKLFKSGGEGVSTLANLWGGGGGSTASALGKITRLEGGG